MKIAALPKRVVYENNPLAEVVCQIRFERLGDFGDAERAALKAEFAAAGYSNYGEEVAVSFVQQVGPVGSTQAHLTKVHVSSFISDDGFWRIGVCPEFVALTCVKYSSWHDFLPRLQVAVNAFISKHPAIKPTRIGLRYKDLIEREQLGLEGVAWHELIRPFLLGPLSPNALAEGQTPADADVGTFLSQTLLKLDDEAMVLLQSSLLTAADGKRRAFLIDADFFNEGVSVADIVTKPDLMRARLEGLHANAGALFYRGITERLHNALHPRA